jgi:hypothetical protein
MCVDGWILVNPLSRSDLLADKAAFGTSRIHDR